jgi:hypothetical protein
MNGSPYVLIISSQLMITRGSCVGYNCIISLMALRTTTTSQIPDKNSSPSK